MTPLERALRDKTLAALNDLARFGDDPKAKISFTRNCIYRYIDNEWSEFDQQLLAHKIQTEMLEALRAVTFDEDTPQHDFCQFIFREKRVWMKIDTLDNDLKFASEDPTDPNVTIRVVTLMAPEDY